MVRLSKKQISKEFEKLTFTPLKNFEGRKRTELEKALKFQRRLELQKRRKFKKSGLRKRIGKI